jgi:hypothetical protein
MKSRRERHYIMVAFRLTSTNSGYLVPLRSTQIFAPLRYVKTSYSRRTLYKMHGANIKILKGAFL